MDIVPKQEQSKMNK